MRPGPDVTNRAVGPMVAAGAAVAVVVVIGWLGGGLPGSTGIGAMGADRVRSEAGRPVAVIIGDSQAHGAQGVEVSDTWVTAGVVAAGYEPVVIAASGTGYLTGRAGEPSYLDGLRDGTYLLPIRGAALVVVEGGGNDPEHPDERITQAARESVALVKNHYRDAEVVVVGPLGRGDSVRRLQINDALARVARDEEVLFLDAGSWGRQYQLEGLFFQDGIHLTGAGHQRLTQPFTTQLEAPELTPTPELTSSPRQPSLRTAVGAGLTPGAPGHPAPTRRAERSFPP